MLNNAQTNIFAKIGWLILLCLFLSAATPLSADEEIASDKTAKTEDQTPAIVVTADNAVSLRAKANKLHTEGNNNEAYDIFKALCLSPENQPAAEVAKDLNTAVWCLQHLNRHNETDSLIEKTVSVHAGNWRLLYKAAWIYTEELTHYGFMIAGNFERGNHRGGGRQMYSFERDRVRALQLLDQASKSTFLSTERGELSMILYEFARIVQQGRNRKGAWGLQLLTDLSKLPDYEETRYYGGQNNQQGCPVDADGNPVFYKLPDSWQSAANDGERWRWLLWQSKELDPLRTNMVMQSFAEFWYHQLGVQTMADYASVLWDLSRKADNASANGDTENADSNEHDTSGIYAVHTLSDSETIARTAIGIRRIKLPDEYNFIRIYMELAEKDAYYADDLARIFENRRQYDKALAWWKQYEPKDPQTARNQISQITKNWGKFDRTPTQPAGEGATINYTFRNGTEATFTARRIDTELLLNEIKEYLSSDPKDLDWQLMQPQNIGWRIVEKHQNRFLKETVAEWSVPLKPSPNHWDKRITIKTPLQNAGAYYLVGKMKDGNEARAILWVQDTAIIQKPLDNQAWYYVADAITGKPLPNLNADFFGFRQEWVRQDKNKSRHHVYTHSLSAQTDNTGQIFIDPDRMRKDTKNYNWIITIKDNSGRFAFLGFNNVWTSHWSESEYNQIKQYLMTDRPVYRPAQEVKWKIWSSTTKYDQPDTVPFAGATFKIEIKNPKGDTVSKAECTADSFGGISGAFTLENEATLGVYSVLITRPNTNDHFSHAGTFRVEEYKKPEFEVTVDAPTEPIMLGESFKAKVTAKYYMGLPVRKGKITYKVLRTPHDTRWFPVRPWDWFYGSGYWWFAYDYPWYPGWMQWGCRAPIWSWWQPETPQPEVIASGDAELTEDGTFEIPVETKLAKLVHGDQDHRYEISAEVTDESRRVITGSGAVIVARAPFKVYASVDCGFYRTGDTINANFNARTAAGKGVQGSGKVTLYKISYSKENKPVETAVQNWDFNTDENGQAELKAQASQKGQYRLSCVVTDKSGHAIEGGYMFVVRGDGYDGRDFRFSQLELVPDKAEYAPGDTVKLMINTDRIGTTVLLFIRPSNGNYLPPKVIHLAGKSVTEEIAVATKDMPNFFVEAVTVYDADVYQTVREIIVPPASRVLNVEMQPDKTAYLPGSDANVKVKLTDENGKPFVGSTVLTVYDKAVEYISGGSNVSDIREFFWKWRRSHYPAIIHNLQMIGDVLLFRDMNLNMQTLGIFGDSLADYGDDDDDYEEFNDADFDTVLGGSAASIGRMRKKTKLGFSSGYSRDISMSAQLCEEVAGAPMPCKALSDSMEKEEAGEMSDISGADPSAAAEPTVRTNFADTAFWAESITTDANGEASMSFKMPENLSGWKFRLWAMGAGARVGESSAEAVTRKNVMIRLQAPRFFVQKDEVVLSAVIHNELEEEKDFDAVLEIPGEVLALVDGETSSKKIRIPSHGQKRVDWRVQVLDEGDAIVRMKALSDVESDAMEMTFPSFIHGMMKQIPTSGVIPSTKVDPNGKGAVMFTFDVPQERRPQQSRLEVRYSPTLAMAMIDAVPYLAEYPYGCTEQTLNKFVPTVLTQRVLLNMGVKLADIRDKLTNLNAQEIGDPEKRAAQWKKNRRHTRDSFGNLIPFNPVYDEEVVTDMVRVGVKRLTDMQVSDGGWGWFSGWGESSYPHTTAVVVRGLRVAKTNGAEVDETVIQRGVKWLHEYQLEQIREIRLYKKTEGKNGKAEADNLDALVYLILASERIDEREMRGYLYRDRSNLSVYAKCAFALGCHTARDTEKRDMLIRNIEQYLVNDDENQTAYLNLGSENFWWCWYGSEYEAHAYYLKLLAAVKPDSPVAPRLVKYLLNNRKHATYWNSTRDTALVLEAFADYIKATGEDNPEMMVQVVWDGKLQKEVPINKENLFTFDNSFVLEGEAVTTGKHTLELRRKGDGPLYANAYLDYFTLEDDIKKAGLEIKVDRTVYRLKRIEEKIMAQGSRGQAVSETVEKYEREPLGNLNTLTSGELIEVELTINSKNDYEYILMEDFKAAGFEATEVRSGYNGNDMGAYVEFRDEKVCFFIRRLARGKHSVRYRLRAEIPGRFSSLPARGYAMYAPELKCNSDEIKLKIQDIPEAEKKE